MIGGRRLGVVSSAFTRRQNRRIAAVPAVREARERLSAAYYDDAPDGEVVALESAFYVTVFSAARQLGLMGSRRARDAERDVTGLYAYLGWVFR